MSSVPLADILRLSPRERLKVVEAIWDSLAADPESVPIPASHVKELKRRIAKLEADPGGSTLPWTDVKKAARKKLGA